MDVKGFIPLDVVALMGEWQRLRPAILRAIPLLAGSHTEEDLAKAVLDGALTFLPGERSFIFFTVDNLPQVARVIILLAGGFEATDEVECMKLVDEALEYGVARHSAKQGMLCLRPGMERIIDRRGEGESTHGWRKLAIVYMKDVG